MARCLLSEAVVSHAQTAAATTPGLEADRGSLQEAESSAALIVSGFSSSFIPHNIVDMNFRCLEGV